MPKLGFYGLDTVPFMPCIFTDFLKLYIFCTKMSYLSVLSYVYTYGRKKNKKKHGAEKEKIFYIYKYKPYDISDISVILVYFLYYFAVNACFAVCIYTRGKNKKSLEQKNKKKIFYIYKYKKYCRTSIYCKTVYFLINFYRHLPKNF